MPKAKHFSNDLLVDILLTLASWQRAYAYKKEAGTTERYPKQAKP
ncbi:MAG: hypothetical protein WCD86_28140 [Ktedonobacteraceae bacterium]